MKYIYLFLAGLLLFSPPEARAKACGKMIFVKGDVHVEKGFRSPKKVKVGTKVCSGDILISKKGRAKLKMLDGNVLSITQNSKFELQKYVYQPSIQKKYVEINLLYGQVRSKVNQKYKKKNQRFLIRTKAAVAGVRGTEFSSVYHKKENIAEFVTFEGLVEVSQLNASGKILKTALVRPGHMVSVHARGGGTPVRLPASELIQKARETMVQTPYKGTKNSGKAPAFVNSDSASAFDHELKQVEQERQRIEKEHRGPQNTDMRNERKDVNLIPEKERKQNRELTSSPSHNEQGDHSGYRSPEVHASTHNNAETSPHSAHTPTAPRVEAPRDGHRTHEPRRNPAKDTSKRPRPPKVNETPPPPVNHPPPPPPPGGSGHNH